MLSRLAKTMLRPTFAGILLCWVSGVANGQIFNPQGMGQGPGSTVHFANQVVPIFSKFGCNGGTCHGKTGGQNGFSLSLFGFEPTDDFDYLVKENRGRRLFPAAPESSLLLLKGAGLVPHGGGKRLDPASDHFRLIRTWIEQGAPNTPKNDSPVVRIEVQPREKVLHPGSTEQLQVLAFKSDGSKIDVTRLAQFDVNDTHLAEVSPSGRITIHNKTGNLAIMIRYQTQVDVFRAIVPLGQKVANLPPPANFIDEIVFKRWQLLGLPPSEPADDATLLRRATIDLAGRIPTVEETAAYLKSQDPNKYEKLVDRLLASPDYAYYFAGKWSAVLRNRRKSNQDDGKITINFHKWIKESLEQNLPFDQFVRQILTAVGTQDERPMVAWYREVRTINEQLEDVSQLFLGQRIACARCHHHPFEKWSQQDYYGLAAFFSRVELKDPPAPKKTKDMKENPKKPPLEVLHKPGPAQALNPRSNKMVRPAGLGASELNLAPEVDPRGKLVDWMTDPSNPYFARALANRYWKHFLGRGLVEPEDDLRVTNPATIPELLDGLADYFVKNKYDLKKLVKAIVLSYPYRLSAEPHAFNAEDTQNLSRFLPRRLQAEVLLDAIDDLVLAKSLNMRAVQLPDNQVKNYFLSVFGRPDFASACECERSGDSNLAQSLHLVNSQDLMGQIAKGRAGKLAKDPRPHRERFRELYLAAYSREPLEEELSTLNAYLERNPGEIQRVYEDIVWSIINTKEFLFNH